MLLDGQLLFDATYTAAGGLLGVNQFSAGITTFSTNVLDMGTGRDMGQAPQGNATLQIGILITTTYLGGTSLNVALQGSTDNVTYNTYAESGAVPIASLVAGNNIFNVVIPGAQPDNTGLIPRYYRLSYTCVGAFTAGAVIAWLGQTDDFRYYKPGVVIAN